MIRATLSQHFHLAVGACIAIVAALLPLSGHSNFYPSLDVELSGHPNKIENSFVLRYQVTSLHRTQVESFLQIDLPSRLRLAEKMDSAKINTNPNGSITLFLQNHVSPLKPWEGSVTLRIGPRAADTATPSGKKNTDASHIDLDSLIEIKAKVVAKSRTTAPSVLSLDHDSLRLLANKQIRFLGTKETQDIVFKRSQKARVNKNLAAGSRVTKNNELLNFPVNKSGESPFKFNFETSVLKIKPELPEHLINPPKTDDLILLDDDLIPLNIEGKEFVVSGRLVYRDDRNIGLTREVGNLTYNGASFVKFQICQVAPEGTEENDLCKGKLLVYNQGFTDWNGNFSARMNMFPVAVDSQGIISIAAPRVYFKFQLIDPFNHAVRDSPGDLYEMETTEMVLSSDFSLARIAVPREDVFEDAMMVYQTMQEGLAYLRTEQIPIDSHGIKIYFPKGGVNSYINAPVESNGRQIRLILDSERRTWIVLHELGHWLHDHAWGFQNFYKGFSNVSLIRKDDYTLDGDNKHSWDSNEWPFRAFKEGFASFFAFSAMQLTGNDVRAAGAGFNTVETVAGYFDLEHRVYNQFTFFNEGNVCTFLSDLTDQNIDSVVELVNSGWYEANNIDPPPDRSGSDHLTFRFFKIWETMNAMSLEEILNISDGREWDGVTALTFGQLFKQVNGIPNAQYNNIIKNNFLVEPL